MFYIRPDFIVVGTRYLLDGRPGVQLLASNSVRETRVDLDVDTECFDLFEPLLEPQPLAHATLRAELRSFAMTYGSDYRTAWEHLMRMGNPDDPQHRTWQNDAIGLPRPALPPGLDT